MYQRQIYKQQLANICMEAKNEKRYFKGIAGVRGKEGELFGIANLLKLNDSVVTNGSSSSSPSSSASFESLPSSDFPI